MATIATLALFTFCTVAARANAITTQQRAHSLRRICDVFVLTIYELINYAHKHTRTHTFSCTHLGAHMCGLSRHQITFNLLSFYTHAPRAPSAHRDYHVIN